MRKLPTILIGALLLPLGTLSATGAVAATTPLVTSLEVVEEPPAEDPPAEDPPAEDPPAEDPPAEDPPAEDPPAEDPPAEDPPAEDPPAEDPPADEDPGEEIPDIEFGEFTSKPSFGNAGTTISVSSVTPCKVDGKVLPDVQFLLFDADALTDEDAAPVVDKLIKTDAKGAWKTTVKVPASAKVGEFYFLEAACFDLNASEDDFPFLIYDFEQFAVTGASEAPIATPVPRDPTFTG